MIHNKKQFCLNNIIKNLIIIKTINKKEKKYIERIIIIIIFSIFCYYYGKYFYKNKIEPELKLELGENDDLCSICLEKKNSWIFSLRTYMSLL
tara:strand:- start:3320 stop:3598 length:279 start_codon:yes stop_codon:yes gene_type:complete